MEVTKADITRAKQALARVVEAEHMIEENKACGITCDEAELRCQDAKKFLTNFLAIFQERAIPR